MDVEPALGGVIEDEEEGCGGGGGDDDVELRGEQVEEEEDKWLALLEIRLRRWFDSVTFK